MGSIKAQRAARLVSENLRTGQPVTYGEILKKAGYATSVSEHPQLVTETKSYKAALIAENAPLLEGLQEEINAIKNAMRAKDKGKEEYRVLAGSLDLLTKNYQLLSGGATERQVFILPSQVIQKNAIDVTRSKPLPIDGSTEPLNNDK